MTIVHNLQCVGVVGTMGIGKVADWMTKERLKLIAGLFNLFFLLVEGKSVKFGMADGVCANGAERIGIQDF